MNLPLTPRQHHALYGYYANALVNAVHDCRHVSAAPSLERRVRHRLANLHCEEQAKVEGVTLMRTDTRKSHTYFIDGKRHSFAQAVAVVVAAARQREDGAG